MGIGNSHDNVSSTAHDTFSHPLLSSEETKQLKSVFARILSKNNSGPEKLKDSKNEHLYNQNNLNPEHLCGFLGLPPTDSCAVELLFRNNLNRNIGGISEEAFVDTTALITHGSKTDMLRVLHRCASIDPGSLFQLLFHLYGGSARFLSSPLVESLIGFNENSIDTATDESKCSIESFVQWCTNTVPSLHEPLRNALLTCCFAVQRSPSIILRSSVEKVIAKSEVIDMSDVFALSCCDARCQDSWDLLFSSNINGMSFNTLADMLIGYGGPTLLVVLDSDNNVFGGLSSEFWRESRTFFGNSSSVLYSLRPYFAVRRARSGDMSLESSNFQYLRLRGRQALLGIGFGGDLKSGLRLFLDNNLEECRASDFCLTYDDGALRTTATEHEGQNNDFVPSVIECWGLGGDTAKKEQEKERVDIERLQTNHRKVDKKQFTESQFDREYLLGKTFH